ncbi:MAG: hypothetical protein H5T97_12490 [Firmicutes bacterium]|nr:hypothetical protein [Bacillota bacterium]
MCALAREFVEMLGERFGLSEREMEILGKNIRRLTRAERRVYFGTLRPRRREFGEFLRRECAGRGREERQRWVEVAAESVLARGGEPDLADELVMQVVGRMAVFHAVRQKADERRVRLHAMAAAGGFTVVLVAVTVITALVIYLIRR